MKVKRFLILRCLMVTFVIFSSCSGEDGADGLSGEQGIQGEQGEQGIQGVQGEPGNANVQRIILSLADIPEGETGIIMNAPELTQELLDTHYIFAYLISGDDFPTYVMIPGRVRDIDRQFDFYYVENNIFIGVSSFDGTDINKGWVPGIFSELHLVLVEISDTIGKSQKEIMTSLKTYGYIPLTSE